MFPSFDRTDGAGKIKRRNGHNLAKKSGSIPSKAQRNRKTTRISPLGEYLLDGETLKGHDCEFEFESNDAILSQSSDTHTGVGTRFASKLAELASA